MARNEGEGRRSAARIDSKRKRVKTGRARRAARKPAARDEDPKLDKLGMPGRDPRPDPDLD